MAKRRKWKRIPVPDPKVKRHMMRLRGGPWDGKQIVVPLGVVWTSGVVEVREWRGRYVNLVWEDVPYEPA